jgi:hypothetical protein
LLLEVMLPESVFVVVAQVFGHESSPESEKKHAIDTAPEKQE